MNVLVCTTSDSKDPSIDAVTAALETRGARVYRFDTDRFPAEMSLTAAWTEGEHLRLCAEHFEVDLSAVDAVWVRHMEPGARLPAGMDPELHAAVRSQADVAVWGLLDCLPVFQLDPPHRLLAAPHKLRQIQLARALGLEVPRTVVTNSASAVRALAQQCPGGLITKMVDSASVAVETADGARPIYTRALSADELGELDGVELCPMIFQERIDKALELRITAVGKRLFAAALSAPSDPDSPVDWRAQRELVSAFEPFELPEGIGAKLLGMLDRVGLNFATFDLIRRRDGRFVFIEMNSLSYFDFVEAATGLPISAAIADLLLALSPRRS